MAKRQFQLSETEAQQFRRAEQQTRDVHELKRLQAVRLYGSGRPTPEIVSMVGCGESTVRQWAQYYRARGIEALRSHWDGQNANKLTAAQRAELKERLQHTRPDQALAPAGRLSQGQFWTVSDLRLVVEHWYGVVYQDEGSYRNLFHRCGFSYQRTERVYKSRPSAADGVAFEAELEKK